jgi:hypothetical protein
MRRSEFSSHLLRRGRAVVAACCLATAILLVIVMTVAGSPSGRAKRLPVHLAASASPARTLPVPPEPPPPTRAQAQSCDPKQLFGAQALSELTRHFGLPEQCGFYESSTWVVFFTGTEPPPGVRPTMAPFGGYSIAVEHCAAGDTACSVGVRAPCSSLYSPGGT